MGDIDIPDPTITLAYSRRIEECGAGKINDDMTRRHDVCRAEPVLAESRGSLTCAVLAEYSAPCSERPSAIRGADITSIAHPQALGNHFPRYRDEDSTFQLELGFRGNFPRGL